MFAEGEKVRILEVSGKHMESLYEKRNAILKDIIKPYFKEAGFKISGLTFNKVENGFIKVFNFQNSGFNLEDNVSFYLNIGIFFPQVFSETVPKNIKTYECHFNLRSDSLTGANQSYNITPATDFNKLKQTIQTDLTRYIIPFYKSLQSLDDCLANLPKIRNPLLINCTPFIGLAFADQGLLDKAKDILNKYLQESIVNENWKLQIKLEASKKGVFL